MDEDIEQFLRRVQVAAPPGVYTPPLQRQPSNYQPNAYAPQTPQTPSFNGGFSGLNVAGGYGGGGGGDAYPDATLIPSMGGGNATVNVTFHSNDPYFPTIQREVFKQTQIGRKMDVDNDPTAILYETKVVSRKHAELIYNNGDIYIRDNGSNAGTFINGNRLSPASQPSEPIKINTGDELQFGTDFRDRNVKEQRAVVVRVILTSGRQLGGQPGMIGRQSSIPSSLDDLRPVQVSAPAPLPQGAGLMSGTFRASAVLGGQLGSSLPRPPGAGLPTPPAPTASLSRSSTASSMTNLTMLGGPIKR